MSNLDDYKKAAQELNDIDHQSDKTRLASALDKILDKNIMSKEYGKNITPILDEIANAMWEIDSRERQQPYEYGDAALPAVSKIMMSVCMDKLWAKQETENTPISERIDQAGALGSDLHDLVKKHLGVDLYDFYNDGDE